MPDKEYYINNLQVLPAEELVTGIRNEDVSFNELQATGDFSSQKQKQVRNIIKKFQEEDDEFNRCINIDDFNEFINKYPQSDYRQKAEIKIKEIIRQQKLEQERKLQEIKDDINRYKPDELRELIGEESLKELCSQLGLDYDHILGYNEPPLRFNDIPQEAEEIPKGFTDVYFWGIPSSGKTTALSAILRTMNDKYAITSPFLPVNFGGSYRDDLVNIYSITPAYLPPRTALERTQYMPFLLKRRKEKNSRYRKTSFFELSGEVFKYFYELHNNIKILKPNERAEVEKAFVTLDLLLNSDNQKIHFFLIDYNKETEGSLDNNNLSQENYLKAAAEYFNKSNEIFDRKTDAVYIILTKSDGISADDKTAFANEFLFEKFGNFMDVLSSMCKEKSVEFGVKIFSIGDVYFKGICKLNYKYAENIIEELLRHIRPENKPCWRKFLRG